MLPCGLHLAFRLGSALLPLVVVLIGGCRSAAPVTLNSLEIGSNQWEIATYYQREAILMQQKAEEYAARAGVYEQLFGPQSDWVKGARLLSQFYTESARDKERLADVHRQLSPDSRRILP
jgi:hypothetical protein